MDAIVTITSGLWIEMHGLSYWQAKLHEGAGGKARTLNRAGEGSIDTECCGDEHHGAGDERIAALKTIRIG